MHRDEIIDEENVSDYLWCEHCERAYERGKHKTRKGMQLCPYADCDADTVLDACDWNFIREINPEYPNIPEEGRVYPKC